MRAWFPLVLLITLGTSAVAACADITRTQAISIHAGWNAVFLEVQPTAAKPADLFARLPVDTVACFFPAHLEPQYLRNPGDAPWRGEGWATWYSPAKPEGSLSDLREIRAQRPLLIHASSEFTWIVTGDARGTRLEWFPNTCTFTGLPVSATAPPTFAEFFAGSQPHRRMRIFRLAGDSWKLVANPAADRPRNGEAYWIQTDGASTYQGPLRVQLPASGELDFDLAGSRRNVEFVNESSASSAHPEIEIILSGSSVPLLQVARDLSKLQTRRLALTGAVLLPALAPGQMTSLQIEPDRSAMSTSSGTTLLRITDGRGMEIWVPVRARRTVVGQVLSQP